MRQLSGDSTAHSGFVPVPACPAGTVLGVAEVTGSRSRRSPGREQRLGLPWEKDGDPAVAGESGVGPALSGSLATVEWVGFSTDFQFKGLIGFVLASFCKRTSDLKDLLAWFWVRFRFVF